MIITKLLHKVKNKKLVGALTLFCIVSSITLITILEFQNSNLSDLNQKVLLTAHEKSKIEKELQELKNQDQVKRNNTLEEEIKKINATYKNSLTTFEKIQDLKAQKQDTSELDKLYASVLSNLSKKNYASGEAILANLNKELDKKIASSAANTVAIGAPSASHVAVSNTAPNTGFSSQNVKTDSGTFLVSMVAADLNSTRVVVDTASDGDCTNECPVLPLATYVARSGAFAGINGSFFCPPEYPQCAGKTNSFDTLLMNKNKTYFNSSNNVYSTVPLMFFSGNSAGVRGRSLDWGRDTGVDAVIANHPLYISDGNNVFGGSSDPKISNKGARTFIANKGSMAYMGIIYGASAADAAVVLKTLGMSNALGLDQGGSTALWYGGYKAGPGRSLPNAVLFVRK